MTREEAIDMLYGMKADNLNLDDAYTKDKYDVLEMAIQALEQEPTKEEQALLQKWRDNRGINIEDFEDAMNALQEPKTEQEDDYFRKIVEVAISQLRADRDRLEDELAKREQEPCEDAISRQAVLEIVEREQFKGDAISEIEKLPPVNPLEAVEQDKSKNNVLEQLKNLIDEFNMQDLSFDEMSGFECKVLELLEQDYICDTCKTAGKE